MSKTFDTRIANKVDTQENWEANNPVLLDGEIIVVKTTDGERRTKIGDGVTAYSGLPFSDEGLRNLIAELQYTIANLNLGFSAGEEDMSYRTLEVAVAKEMEKIANGTY